MAQENPAADTFRNGWKTSEVQIGSGVMSMEIVSQIIEQFTGQGIEIPTELWYLLIVQFAGRSLAKFAIEWRRTTPPAPGGQPA